MRKGGEKVGLLRLRTITPWPAREVGEALEGARHVAVFEKNLSPGRGGMMTAEIKASLLGKSVTPTVTEFIMGLGGNPESIELFRYGARLAKKDRHGEVYWLD
jgi:pyruvate ferredoxin oxidoreductase alpha subunit